MLENAILESFESNYDIGHIAYKYNVKKQKVEDIWNSVFGLEKVKNRKKKFEHFSCPVCNRKGTKEFIKRHVMNSQKEIKHKKFIESQDDIIRNIYINGKDVDLDPYEISYDLFCSASHIRKIFSEFENYKERARNKKKLDMIEQYKNGRERPKSFNWVLTKENGGKRFIDRAKIKEIHNLYDSSLTQKEIAKLVGCKEETVRKYLVEKFGVKSVDERKQITRKRKITIDTKINLRECFFNNMTKNEISKNLDISYTSILEYYKKVFSKKLRDKRVKEIRKSSIIKSFKICGKRGITGSLPENKCYELLSKSLKHIVCHHDLDVLPPYEVDITIPELKVAISWDGIFHRKPIFGKENLDKVIKRDRKKERLLLKKGWKLIKIQDDDSKMREEKIEKTVNNIIELIKHNFKTIMISN